MTSNQIRCEVHQRSCWPRGQLTIYGVLILWLYACLASASSRQTQHPLQHHTDTEGFDATFDDYVSSELAKHHVPGLSVAVVDGDSVFSKGYGHARLPDVKATADTQYYSGSTGKAFTAAIAALLMNDEHRFRDLTWKSKISDYIREDFVLEDEWATTHLTIEDALSHRSGLPAHDLAYGLSGDNQSTVVRRLRHLPLTKELRTTFQYCNVMFAVVGDLLETITGRNLGSLLHELIWQPLGMNSTIFSVTDSAISGSLARGYYFDMSEHARSRSEDDRYVEEQYTDLSPIAGAGALISTVNDYTLWIKAILHAAKVDGAENKTSPITRDLYGQLFSPRTIIFDAPEYPSGTDFLSPSLYALGWDISKILNQTVLHHTGSLTGFGTTLYIVPEKSYGLVTMANTQVTGKVVGSNIAAKLLMAKFGRPDETSRVQTLLHTLSHDGLAFMQDENVDQCVEVPDDIVDHRLRVNLSDYQGAYFHPGYGSFNLSVASCGHDSILRGFLYPRTWPYKLELTHRGGLLFESKLLFGHGTADIRSADIVWELISNDRAVFELDSDGQRVAMLGLVLEPRMAWAAREKGKAHWKESMIWFERQ